MKLADDNQTSVIRRGFKIKKNISSALIPKMPAGIVNINGRFHKASILFNERFE